jgi:hypothetical protein
MIRLESSGSDCTMGAGFRENSIYSTYTHIVVFFLRYLPLMIRKDVLSGAELIDDNIQLNGQVTVK